MADDVGAREPRERNAADACQDAVARFLPGYSNLRLAGENRPKLSIDRRAADILFFSIIDWDFRIQRPQHLARSLAEAHHRVFYISVHFGDYAGAGRFRIVQQPEPRVFEVQLLVSAKINRIYGGFTANKRIWLLQALPAAVALAAIVFL